MDESRLVRVTSSVGVEAIGTAIRELGLAGRAVCAHASLRSFGYVEGGADAIIDAFLREGCTLMVASHSHGVFGLPRPEDVHIERNGEGGWIPARPAHDRVFSPELNDADEMGALVVAVLQRSDRVRGNHPLGSFAAVGPLASKIVGGQAPLDIYAPLATLAKLDGAVVLMGVGLNRMTLIHLAEKRSGRTLFRRWANDTHGRRMAVEAGSCSEGFVNLEPALRQIRRDATVGDSLWHVYDARSALNVATHAIRRNQRITHCGEPCSRCDDATAGGPILRT